MSAVWPAPGLAVLSSYTLATASISNRMEAETFLKIAEGVFTRGPCTGRSRADLTSGTPVTYRTLRGTW